MSANPKSLLRLALLCSALVVLAPSPALGAASAKGTLPCWKRLMNDWYSGQIKHTYAPACYTEAIKNMPPDLTIYSSARQDIERALQARLAGKPIPPESVSLPRARPRRAAARVRRQRPRARHTRRRASGLFVAKLTPGDPQAFPLPLLILGALAILLVAAGAVGMLWQRSHPRDEPPPA